MCTCGSAQHITLPLDTGGPLEEKEAPWFSGKPYQENVVAE